MLTTDRYSPEANKPDIPLFPQALRCNFGFPSRLGPERAAGRARRGSSDPCGCAREPRRERRRLRGRARTAAPCPLPCPGQTEHLLAYPTRKTLEDFLSGYIRRDRLLLRGSLGTRVAALLEFLPGCWGFIKIYLVCQELTSVASGAWFKKKSECCATRYKVPPKEEVIVTATEQSQYIKV